MIDLIPADHEQRREVENFIHQRFAESHNANISHFMPYLLRIREDGSGAWRAVAGLRPAATSRGNQPLFLERYLDQPVEQTIFRTTDSAVDRQKIVEIGNLAETSPGGGRHAIIALTGFLAGYGFHWVVFTAIPRLANAFPRLGMEPTPLATASPDKLSAKERKEWGNYYDEHPTVLCGRISDGFRTLDDLNAPISTELHASLLVGYHIGRWWRSKGLE